MVYHVSCYSLDSLPTRGVSLQWTGSICVDPVQCQSLPVVLFWFQGTIVPDCEDNLYDPQLDQGTE
jgi:hypothetical protein